MFSFSDIEVLIKKHIPHFTNELTNFYNVNPLTSSTLLDNVTLGLTTPIINNDIILGEGVIVKGIKSKIPYLDFTFDFIYNDSDSSPGYTLKNISFFIKVKRRSEFIQSDVRPGHVLYLKNVIGISGTPVEQALYQEIYNGLRCVVVAKEESTLNVGADYYDTIKCIGTFKWKSGIGAPPVLSTSFDIVSDYNNTHDGLNGIKTVLSITSSSITFQKDPYFQYPFATSDLYLEEASVHSRPQLYAGIRYLFDAIKDFETTATKRVTIFISEPSIDLQTQPDTVLTDNVNNYSGYFNARKTCKFNVHVICQAEPQSTSEEEWARTNRQEVEKCLNILTGIQNAIINQEVFISEIQAYSSKIEIVTPATLIPDENKGLVEYVSQFSFNIEYTQDVARDVMDANTVINSVSVGFKPTL
jgi:hypothetical protein